MYANKVALVTGGSRGIGKGIAVQLSALGYKVVINYNRDKQSAESVLEITNKNAVKSVCYKADLSDIQNIDKLFDFIANESGRLDVLVNNAGYAPIIKTEKVDEKNWNYILDVNLKSAFFCSQKAMALMKEVGRGRIINIGSQAGITGGFHSGAHYAIAKGGINTLTKRLAVEGAPYNILVNCISPGIIDTDGVNAYPDEIIDDLIEKIPLKRIGKSSDVVNVVKFLISEKSNYLTGVNIPVNGGIYMN